MKMKMTKAVLAVAALVGACAYGEWVDVSSPDTEETLGVVKFSRPTNVNDEVALSVPFLTSPTYGTNTVDTLLVAGYDTNDDIRVWNSAAKQYDAWYWDDGWQVAEGTSDAAEASEQAVPRGLAFWFRNESHTNDGFKVDLAVAGLVKTGAVTRVSAGSADSRVLTLLTNPYGTEVNLIERLSAGAVNGDQISLVDGTMRFEFKDGSWGRWIPGGRYKVGKIWINKPDTFETCTEIIVPAGTAVWYASVGGAPTVSWD